MLSRVANSVYWMSRYLERADNVARFIDVNMRLMMEMGYERDKTQWRPLLQASGDEDRFSQHYTEANEINVIRFLTFDRKNPNSIISCIQKARENARTVREIILGEQWEIMNELYLSVEKYSRKRRIDDYQPLYAMIKRANNLYLGFAEDALFHDEGWHFSRMGRMLERADKTTRILDVKYFLLLPTTEMVDSAHDAVEWGAVLKSTNAFQMYRRQFHRVNYRDVAAFLLFNEKFPRAVTYCIDMALVSLVNIVNSLNVNVPAMTEMNTLSNMLRDTNVDKVLSNGLHEFVDIFQYNLNIVDEAINASFFDNHNIL